MIKLQDGGGHLWLKKCRNEFIELHESDKETIRIVDVLAHDRYEREHIQGAISIPLNEIENQAEQKLDKDDIVVVYCANTDCDASSKASVKLEALGFKHIYDYEAGVEDYKLAGRPVEGSGIPQEAVSR